MRKAVVRQSDGFVENVIVIEEGAKWKPPGGCKLIDASNGSPGDTWDGAAFVKPLPVETKDPLTELRERIEHLEEELGGLEEIKKPGNILDRIKQFFTG